MNSIKPEDYIPVIVNSLDSRSVTLSMEVVFESINALGKHPFLVVITSTGLVQARNKGFETLKKTFNTDMMTGLMLDSDILIYPESFVYEEMKKALDEKYNITTGYVSTYGVVNILNEETKQLMKFEEYAKIPDLSPIKRAGLGFYFGVFPLNYHFTFDDSGGEDFQFYDFVNQIQPTKLAKKIHLGHMKYLSLNIPDYGDA